MEARSRLHIGQAAFWVARRWAGFAWLLAAAFATAFVDIPREARSPAPPAPEALPAAPRSQDPPSPPATEEKQEEVDPSEQAPA
jgi:hypothetical protein